MSRRLLVITTCLVMVVIGLGIWDPYGKTLTNRILGGVLVICGAVPIFRWILNVENYSRFPAFEILSLFYAGCFGIAGFISHERLQGRLFVEEEDYTIALVASLSSWILIGIGYRFFNFKGLRFSRVPSTTSKSTDQLIIFVYPILFSTQLVINFLEIESLTQLVTATRMFIVFWMLYLALSPRKTTTGRFKHVPIVFFTLDLIVFGGLLEGRLLSLVTYGLAYVFCQVLLRKKFPAAFIFIVVISFIVLQPAKAAFRYVTWTEGKVSTGLEGFRSLTSLGASIVDQFSVSDGVGVAGLIFNEAYLRLNHLHTLAAVVRDTPSEVPFAKGETLVPLLTKFIPRAIWADKPLENLGNRWAHEYQYLSSDDFVTSYNLPWVPEMFMNFGWTGIIILSVLIGIFLSFMNRFVFSDVVGPVRFSLAVSVGVVFAMPESNLSSMIGGLLINWGVLSITGMLFISLGKLTRRKTIV